MQTKHRIIICFICLFLSFSIYEFQNIYHKKIHKEELINITKSGTDQIESIALEIRETLTELAKLNFNECNKETLLSMNKQLFWSHYVKDIGYFDNDTLICTTGLGILENEVVDENPDLIDSIGNHIWLNQKIVLFHKEISAILIRNGKFNVVVERKYLQNIIPSKIDWELVFNHEGNFKHISGTEGINNEYLANNKSFIKRCSHLFPYCVIVRNTFNNTEKLHDTRVLTSAIISLLVFFLSYSILHRTLIQYHSTRSRVLRGLRNNAFFVVYQPIVELKSGKIIGCEVLARYKDKDGNVTPDQFIPIISNEGMTWTFTHHLLQKIFNDVACEESLPSNFKININFFPQDISTEKILRLKDYKEVINAKVKYVVEVTEDEQLNHRNSPKVLSQLQEIGLDIAIDDFGTGYSNLKQLQSLECHTLKIDRSFVSEMEEGSIKSTLIPHIVDIAQKINANIVAEGIENRMQLHSLLSIGVGFGQGWLFGRPTSLKKINEMFQLQ